jgi:hypothetical protein
MKKQKLSSPQGGLLTVPDAINNQMVLTKIKKPVRQKVLQQMRMTVLAFSGDEVKQIVTAMRNPRCVIVNGQEPVEIMYGYWSVIVIMNL